MRPICVPCRVFMKINKNGVPFIEGIIDKKEGIFRPLKLWDADLWRCPNCKTETLRVSDAQQPMAEAHEKHFKQLIDCYPEDPYWIHELV